MHHHTQYEKLSSLLRSSSHLYLGGEFIEMKPKEIILAEQKEIVRRHQNILNESGLKTLQDVWDFGKDKFMKLPGIGNKSALAIEMVAKRHGLIVPINWNDGLVNSLVTKLVTKYGSQFPGFSRKKARVVVEIAITEGWIDDIK